MREWVRQKSPIKEGAVAEGSAGWRILNRTQGTRGRSVNEVMNEVKSGLQKADTEDDLKRILRSAMHQLEHERTEVDSVAPSNGESESKITKVNFDEVLGREKPRGKLVRYQLNPRANWGPMSRANGGS
jgi:tRNA (guanine26-N2/guanine27-N2)-dimethyltransferase